MTVFTHGAKPPAVKTAAKRLTQI